MNMLKDKREAGTPPRTLQSLEMYKKDLAVAAFYESERSNGVPLAHPALIQILMNTKAPYNISTPTASLALSALSPEGVSSMRQKVLSLVEGRTWLLQELSKFGDLGPPIGGNDANFVMVPVLEKNGSGKPDSLRAQRVYKALAEEEGVVVLDAALIAANDDRLQELVSLALLVTLFDSRDWIGGGFALAQDDALQTDLNTVPPLVPVHHEVSSHDRCNLAQKLPPPSRFTLLSFIHSY